MYTDAQRSELLERVVAFLKAQPEFEGLVQMGSGAEGFRDIYSDIDLMAGCRDVAAAGEKLRAFFEGQGAVYIDSRRWSDSVRGYSAYWENGLSVDISYMPTDQIPVQSKRIRILFSKDEAFTRRIRAGLENLKPKTVDDSIHHPFIYALRRCEIAMLRGEYICADMALSEAREMLLGIEGAREGKDVKRYNELDAAFLTALEGTYPVSRRADGLRTAKENLLALYLDTVSGCPFLSFDHRQLKLIGCFE